MTTHVLDTAHSEPASVEPTEPAGPSPTEFRRSFRSAAASTWVVTGSGPSGPVGFTAISVVSVSVSPPIVSFNISRASHSLPTVSRSGRAALHLLATDQTAVAERFAADRRFRFVDDGTWSVAADGLPIVHGVVTRLVTRIVDLVDAGDSFIAVAAVESAVTTNHDPLVRRAGAYHALHSLIGA